MKKTLALAALGAMTLGLAACGDGEKNATVSNEAVVVNSGEDAVFGNEAVLLPGNETAPLSANTTGNTL